MAIFSLPHRSVSLQYKMELFRFNENEPVVVYSPADNQTKNKATKMENILGDNCTC